MAEDSAAKHRARQTIRNLALSLLACLGLVLALILIVPRDESSRIQRVDYKSIGTDVASSTGLKIVIPELPEGWWCNKATWTGKSPDGVKTWYIGFVGPQNQYVGFTQAFDVNPTWFVGQLGEGAAAVQPKPVGDWFQYDALVQHDPAKTRDHVWALGFSGIEKAKGNAYLLYGADKLEDFKAIAGVLKLDASMAGAGANG